jgi:ABC-type phosphate transport system substrate-binding protein
MFLRLQTAWPEGGNVKPVDQAKSSPVREAFSREVLGKSIGAVEQYWTQAIFSGRAVPPVEKRSDADVVAYVRETPGAIGYVSPGASTEGVKRLGIKD